MERTLVFEETFVSGTKLNEEVWSYDIGAGFWGNNESQYYTQSDKNVRIEEDGLKITAHKEEIDGNHYSSGRIQTRGKKTWQYGRFVIRAKMPAGKGTWPAIWMLGVKEGDEGWPAIGEIDIMEHVGRTQDIVHFSLHTKKYNHRDRTQITHVEKIDDVTTSFHDYVLDWDAEKIAFEVDGIQRACFYKKDYADSWPFDKPYYLILNQAIGGGFGGEIDDSIFPQTLQIQSIRIYQ